MSTDPAETVDTEGASPQTWTRLFDALSASQRRRLLINLLDHNPQDESPPAVDAGRRGNVGEESRQLEMVHIHLPKLADQDFIEWDRENQEVLKGERFEEIRPVLELLHRHRDELPDGWL